MPELDEVDARILGILVEDGRRSFREIARRAGITTPTVQTRIKRMTDEGLILGVSPIFNPSKLQHGLVFQLYLQVNPAEIEEIARKLGKRSEVRGIYLTTGENNLALRIVASSLDDLQQFTETLDRDFGVKQNSSQMILRIFKDDQAVVVRPGMGIHLKCETCNGPIPAKPFVLRVAGHERFFCCPMCLEKFREKYEPKLKGLQLTVEAPARI
ncbi:MAG TPA: AsnC family transcriptional regulator [Candidatus Bathyarchaeia archaeon]|nr:AsnC family transcriptional regulator [Candidatus Bathyarchaeia archaeon]